MSADKLPLNIGLIGLAPEVRTVALDLCLKLKGLEKVARQLIDASDRYDVKPTNETHGTPGQHGVVVIPTSISKDGQAFYGSLTTIVNPAAPAFKERVDLQLLPSAAEVAMIFFTPPNGDQMWEVRLNGATFAQRSLGSFNITKEKREKESTHWTLDERMVDHVISTKRTDILGLLTDVVSEATQLHTKRLHALSSQTVSLAKATSPVVVEPTDFNANDPLKRFQLGAMAKSAIPGNGYSKGMNP